MLVCLSVRLFLVVSVCMFVIHTRSIFWIWLGSGLPLRSRILTGFYATLQCCAVESGEVVGSCFQGMPRSLGIPKGHEGVLGQSARLIVWPFVRLFVGSYARLFVCHFGLGSVWGPVGGLGLCLGPVLGLGLGPGLGFGLCAAGLVSGRSL